MARLRRRIGLGGLTSWWVVVAVFVPLLYFVAATSAWAFIRYSRGYDTVSLLDVAWPLRWTSMRVKQGEHQIERGLRDLRELRVSEGFFNLRVGVLRAPAHQDGRRALATIYQVIGQRGSAIETLAEGLQHFRPTAAYLDVLVTLLLEDGQHERARAICAGLLDDPDVPADLRRQAVLSLGIIQFASGDYEESRLTFEQAGLTNDPMIQEVMAGIDWEQGRREAATARLEALRQAQPTLDRLYVQLTRYYDALGRPSDSERVRLLRRLANPNSVQVAADQVRHFLKQERRDEALAEFRRAASLFSARGRDLEELAEVAASYGLIGWIDELEQVAARAGGSIERINFFRLLALTAAGEFRRALALVADIESAKPRWLGEQEAVVNGVAAVAHFAIGEDAPGEGRINRTLRAAARRPRSLPPLAQLLLSTGAPDAARRLLVGGLELEPRNAVFLGSLILLDLGDGRTPDLLANLERFLTLPDAGQEVLLQVQEQLATDRFIFVKDRESWIARARRAADRAPQVRS